MYYDSALSSVYFVDNDADASGFNAAFLVKKEIQSDSSSLKHGCWDAIHVVTCSIKGSAAKADYRVISTIMVTVDASNEQTVGKMTLAGTCARTSEESVTLPSNFGSKAEDDNKFHVRVIGQMIEQNESTLRSEITSTFVMKQMQITNSGRLAEAPQTEQMRKRFMEEVKMVSAAINAKRAPGSEMVYK